MRRLICLIVFIAYFITVLYVAVLSRDIVERKTPLKMELFQDYFQQNNAGYHDTYINIALFLLVGIIVSLLPKKHKVAMACLVGLICSLIIEASQLIWKKGTFDVNDLFNNTLGALIGALITLIILRIRKPNT